MSGLIRTIGSLFDPLLNFFQQIWDYIVFIISFLWDLVEGLYYGFNTIISHLRSNLQDIFLVSFLSDSSFVISGYTQFLGISVSSMFNSLLLCAIFLVGIRFVWSLIPFFRK